MTRTSLEISHRALPTCVLGQWLRPSTSLSTKAPLSMLAYWTTGKPLIFATMWSCLGTCWTERWTSCFWDWWWACTWGSPASSSGTRQGLTHSQELMVLDREVYLVLGVLPHTWIHCLLNLDQVGLVVGLLDIGWEDLPWLMISSCSASQFKVCREW